MGIFWANGALKNFLHSLHSHVKSSVLNEVTIPGEEFPIYSYTHNALLQCEILYNKAGALVKEFLIFASLIRLCLSVNSLVFKENEDVDEEFSILVTFIILFFFLFSLVWAF